MIDLELVNKMRRGEIDINNQSLFFSILIKGLMRHLYDELTIRGISIPHIIINTGDDLMYLGVKGYDQNKEPLDISNEDYVYNVIPRCTVSPKGINLAVDQLTSPYAWGQFQYESDDIIGTFRAEVRRIPLTMQFSLVYYLDTYTDLLEMIQQTISNLSFIRTFDITYLGQKITCSYKIPESFDGEYTLDIDGAYSDNKSRKLSLDIEVETCFPIYNKRSIMSADHFVKDVHLEMNDDKTILDERDGHLHGIEGGIFDEGDKKLPFYQQEAIDKMKR